MLFEPVFHEKFAEKVRKTFPNWDGDINRINHLLPTNAQSFDRTRILYVLDGSTDKLCEITVTSLRELFRGNGELVIDCRDFKEEYIPFFYPTESAILEVSRLVPKSMITDGNFMEIYSTMRRRPDGKSLGYLHDVVWQLAADFMIRRVCSQNEFEACFRRLEQSARTWHTSPTSANYIASIESFKEGMM